MSLTASARARAPWQEFDELLSVADDAVDAQAKTPTETLASEANATEPLAESLAVLKMSAAEAPETESPVDVTDMSLSGA